VPERVVVLALLAEYPAEAVMVWAWPLRSSSCRPRRSRYGATQAGICQACRSNPVAAASAVAVSSTGYSVSSVQRSTYLPTVSYACRAVRLVS